MSCSRIGRALTIFSLGNVAHLHILRRNHYSRASTAFRLLLVLQTSQNGLSLKTSGSQRLLPKIISSSYHYMILHSRSRAGLALMIYILFTTKGDYRSRFVAVGSNLS